MSERFDATANELALFTAECAEQLAEIERFLIQLEEGGEPTEPVAELFRNAHSLKGWAAAIGHHRMASLAHALESAMERHRTGGAPVTAEDTDTYLAVVDALSRLGSEVSRAEASGVDVDGLVAQLAATGLGASAPDVPGRAPAGSAVVLELVVTFRADEPMTAVRAIQVLLRAGELGKVVEAQPPMGELEQGRFEGRLELVIEAAGSIEAVAAELRRIEGVERVEALAGADPSLDPASDGGSGTAETGVASAGAGQPAARAEGAAPSDAAQGQGGAAGQGGTAQGAPQTVRIDVARLDALMALVGELVIDRTRIAQIASRLERKFGGDGAVEELAVAATHLERISTALQAEVMKSRLLPVDAVFSRFPRLVRDVARRLGKEVHLEVTGRETELDRSVIEEIADPLVHLIRNAIDHGIELPGAREAAGKPRTGTIRLGARYEESYILVEVEDDGGGIDPARVAAGALARGLVSEEAVGRMSDQEKIDLIFLPGFSLAQGVTDLSGRGVGMDVVRSNVQRLKGSVALRTVKGQGTCITVKLPLTLAILRALLVGASAQRFAIPLTSVVETLRIREADIQRMSGAEVIRVRGDVLPIVRLREALRLPGERTSDRSCVVAVHGGSRQFGVLVDELVGEQEIVVKPIGSMAGDVAGIAGATILGDGRVAPILDVNALVHESTPSQAQVRQISGAWK